MSYEEHVFSIAVKQLPALTALLGEEFIRDWTRPINIDRYNLDFPSFPAPQVPDPPPPELRKPTYKKKEGALPIGFKPTKEKKRPNPLNERPGGNRSRNGKKAKNPVRAVKKVAPVPSAENCD